MGVFEVVDEKECYDNGCKPLMLKWVDKMIGEKCRSRLVCREIKRAKDRDEQLEAEDVFSHMPPSWLKSILVAQGSTADAATTSLSFCVFDHDSPVRCSFFDRPGGRGGANPVSQTRGLSGMDPGLGGGSAGQDRSFSSGMQSHGLSGMGFGFGGSSPDQYRVDSSGRRRVDGPVDHPPERPRHGLSGFQFPDSVPRLFSPGPGVGKDAGGDCVPRFDSFPPLDRDPGNARLTPRQARPSPTSPVILTNVESGFVAQLMVAWTSIKSGFTWVAV